MVRHLLNLKDIRTEELKGIIKKAIEIKKNPGNYSEALKDKTLVMYFEKTSTRTRLSFEAGMTKLGGHGIFLDKRTTQISISELKDEIRAIERYADIMMARVMKHSTLLEMAKNIKVPLINGCCEKYHPVQGIGDAMTMIENCGSLEGKNVVWMGIGNNVSNSLINVCTKLGAKISMIVAEKHPLSVDEELIQKARETDLYEETKDLNLLKNADFVHTDTWVDMELINDPGFKKEKERRLKALAPYQLNKALLEKYGCNGKIMHCMPCHVGYEITRDAIDHKNSIIFDQAENRMWSQMAVMLFLLGKM